MSPESTRERPPANGLLRIIAAGVGFWGGSWISVVRASPHWELAALVDTDSAALDRAAASSGLDRSRGFPSIAAAAEAVESDAVLVVVPPAYHARLALEALDRGLHCLIEKPFASTISDAVAVVERGAAADRVVMVSQQYRHRAGARTVARLLEEGSLGRIGAVYVHFASDLPVRGFQHEMQEPLLWDMAIHHFDLVRGALGLEPVRVQAVSSNPPWSPFAGNAAASVVFETGDGIVVTYTGSWAPRGRRTGWDGVWEILCEAGSIWWDGNHVSVDPVVRPLRAKLARRVPGREWKGLRIRPEAIGEPDRLGSLAEFAAAIRERREPETSGRDNLRSLALTIAAVESASRRAALDVGEVG